MTHTSDSATRGSTTVLKALALLRTVAEFPRGATAAELASASGQPFSTAYRLLHTLVTSGFVEFDARTKIYSLGLPVFELGQRVGHARGFTNQAAPVLERLSTATQESCILALLDGTETFTVLTVDGLQYRITTDPGDRGPLNTSAIGKVLLAWQSNADRDALLREARLVARTENSVTEVDALRAQLEVARAQGWAEQCEEHDLGMLAVGVPVVRPDGTLIAALALAAPVFRADITQLRARVPQLQRAADQLGALLP